VVNFSAKLNPVRASKLALG